MAKVELQKGVSPVVDPLQAQGLVCVFLSRFWHSQISLTAFVSGSYGETSFIHIISSELLTSTFAIFPKFFWHRKLWSTFHLYMQFPNPNADKELECGPFPPWSKMAKVELTSMFAICLPWFTPRRSGAGFSVHAIP
ncbi:MAG: hypothetical protein NZ602_05355 [Thermoguttaceae bacterium]|nr:hypothetical protein [Thermoguttaceae bacterium]